MLHNCMCVPPMCVERYTVLNRRLLCAQVRETIMTSALLRLPLSVPRREKVQRVDAIIAELVSTRPLLKGTAPLLSNATLEAVTLASFGWNSSAAEGNSSAPAERHLVSVTPASWALDAPVGIELASSWTGKACWPSCCPSSRWPPCSRISMPGLRCPPYPLVIDPDAHCKYLVLSVLVGRRLSVCWVVCHIWA